VARPSDPAPVSSPAITLVIDRLEDLLAEAGSKPPVLDRILSRGKFTSPPEFGGLGQFLELDWPGEAALTRRVDAPDDFQGCWLRADPACLVADINRVWISPIPAGAVESDLRQRLEAELKNAFADQGLDFDWPTVNRGYVRCSSRPESRFVPMNSIGGRGLDEVLPEGPDQSLWRRLLNESQMIFHQARQPGDSTRPNSLWLWGPGQTLVAPESHRLEGHMGGSPLIDGLADWLSLPVADGLDSITGRVVAAWQPDPAESAEANLEKLADQWLGPVWRRLVSRRLSALTLVTGTGFLEISARQAWFFWRKTPGLVGQDRR